MLMAVLVITTAGTALADALRYENTRFGTRFVVPAHMFNAIDPPPGNSDGIRFVSANGATLSIFGQFNALDETPVQMQERLAGHRADQGQSVTFEATGENWLVLSGSAGSDIYYSRYEFGGDETIHGAILVHPATDAATYQNLVESFDERLSGP